MEDHKIAWAASIARMFEKQAKVVLAERKAMGGTGTTGTRASGMLRRLSMDLTRALAEMRRP